MARLDVMTPPASPSGEVSLLPPLRRGGRGGSAVRQIAKAALKRSNRRQGGGFGTQHPRPSSISLKSSCTVRAIRRLDKAPSGPISRRTPCSGMAGC